MIVVATAMGYIRGFFFSLAISSSSSLKFSNFSLPRPIIAVGRNGSCCMSSIFLRVHADVMMLELEFLHFPAKKLLRGMSRHVM